MDGRANPLMNRNVFKLCFLKSMQWSPHPHLLDVVWCSVAIVAVAVIVVVVAVVVVVVWLCLLQCTNV